MKISIDKFLFIEAKYKGKACSIIRCDDKETLIIIHSTGEQLTVKTKELTDCNFIFEDEEE